MRRAEAGQDAAEEPAVEVEGLGVRAEDVPVPGQRAAPRPAGVRLPWRAEGCGVEPGAGVVVVEAGPRPVPPTVVVGFRLRVPPAAAALMGPGLRGAGRPRRARDPPASLTRHHTLGARGPSCARQDAEETLRSAPRARV